MSIVRSRCASLLATVTLALAFVAASIVVAPPARAATISPSERWIATQINRARIATGARTLSLRTNVSDIARVHTRRMVRAGRIFHSRDLAASLGALSWGRAGENVGRGPSVGSVFRAFMASPGHRANILNRSYDRVGVGVLWRNGSAYITVMFLG